MVNVPKSKLEALKNSIRGVEMPFDISGFIAEQITDAIENDVEIWPVDCESGIGFFAAIGDLWADDALNTRSKPMMLRDIVETEYLVSDDSDWERAEILGLELKALSDELLASAARGKARWPKEGA